ncbi:MAG: peptidylprolyl isomerase [Coriobacteriia bacterium]|nr:peptidylprolyl isomerase [Coriobacteriia bacterium]MBN2822494.1 peptidylprolyl isomerase [Coriobacteriia bacterium]
MPAVNGDKVAVHYTGTLDDGSEFDSSEGRDPLVFTLGEGEVIPGFETAVMGLEPGSSASIVIAPEDAYGPVHPEAMQEVSMELFGEDVPPQGVIITLVAEDGTRMPATVASFSEDGASATLDFNHPLAGQTLHFDIKLVEIVEA